MTLAAFSKKHTHLTQYTLIIFGSALYAVATNLFVVPMDLYSSGFVGVAQIIRSLLVQYAGVQFPAGFDVAGIINFIINIPLFYLAYHSISRGFLLRTLTSLATMTILFSIIPIPETPIIEDMLSACLIGGITTGAGIGIIFYASGSAGGVDILGFYATKKKPGFTVGKLSIIFNTIVYLICALIFDVKIAIYSIIYITVFSLVIDKIHLQNINIMALVVTKQEGVPEHILKELGRGVTAWKGVGTYTGEDVHVYMTMISKYEISRFRHYVHEKDPHAFIVLNEGASILGNFVKRL